MKKLLTVLLLLLCLAACGSKDENEISALLNDGYNIETSGFSENEWKGLFLKDGDYLIVTAKMTPKLYEDGNEVFFEDDKYLEFIKKLEVINKENINDRIPTMEDLQKYVGKKFGELEDEGFENMGYCESDNYQYNFNYENDTICIIVKSDASTPIKDMDDFSNNDIRELIVAEVVDFYVSSNVLVIE